MNRLFMTTITLTVAASSGPLAADITRGCKAFWEVRAGTASRTFGKFDSRGSCRGKAKANDCRRQARSFAQQCFRDHWARRNSASIKSGASKPPHCLGRRGNIGVRNYSVTDVKRALEQTACAMQFSPPFRVRVIGRTSGDKRCAGEVPLTSTYEIRDAMCGKP